VRRGQWIGLFIILLLFVLSIWSVAIPQWRVPVVDFVRGEEDTPMGLTLGLDLQGGVHLVYETVDPNPTQEQLEGTIAVIRNRVDAFGVAEPLIQTLGQNRVLVQLPGVEDVEAAKNLIGAPAVLDFRELRFATPTPTATPDPNATPGPNETPAPGATPGPDTTPAPTETPVPEGAGTPVGGVGALAAPLRQGVETPAPTVEPTPPGAATPTPGPATSPTPEATPGASATPEGTPGPGATPEPPQTTAEFVIASAVVDGEEVQLTGDRLVPGSAQVGFDPNTGAPEVRFQLDRQGAEAFRLVTARNVGLPLGIFLDGQGISLPIVEQEIAGGNPRITGLTLEEARILAIQLNAGAFPTPLQPEPVLQRNVDAFLGANALERGLAAGMVGLALVMLYMVLYYRMTGLVAAGALVIYAAFTLALFKMVPIVLTLSGLAAFVLSIGFAVDANVLIFERMKEELRAGRSLASAIEIGFNRAWPAIRDGNVTTIITAVILFWFGDRLGASAVQGFALTLAIGVGMSMLTALFVSRRFLQLFVGRRISRRLSLFGM
jgi:preprotein translocase subunit SecD